MTNERNITVQEEDRKYEGDYLRSASASEANTKPTISVAVLKGSQLDGVQIDVYTWFSSPSREFKKAPVTKEWRFDGVMLPGQGFSVVFSRSEQKVTPSPKN